MPDRLNPGDKLALNQSLTSSDGAARLTLQGSDGNLVLSFQNLPQAFDNGPQWASHTEGRGVAELDMQASDGNLVLNSPEGPVWASNTAGHRGAHLIVQDDGNMVIYDGAKAIWATNTFFPRRPPFPPDGPPHLQQP